MPADRVLVLLNTGTPSKPETGAVRRYLREFLSDPRVLDIHPVARKLLLELVILPTRPSKSAKLYRSIWTPDGSPLLYWSERQRAALAERMPDTEVLLAMRYGQPSISQAVARIRALGPREVLLAPLFPQYASASSGSAIEASLRALGQLPYVPAVRVLPPFYSAPGFVSAWAERLREALGQFQPDHVLLSYHGLPVRQVQATCPEGSACGAEDGRCCTPRNLENAHCYRSQALETSRLLQEALGLPKVSTSFQSRLGRDRWLSPSTEEMLEALPKAGVKRLLVACPSFVSDCLETLEEIAVRGKESFVRFGGVELQLVPCLNDAGTWLDALEALVRAEWSRRDGVA